MSINAITNAATARHVGTVPKGAAPQTLRQIAAAFSKAPSVDMPPAPEPPPGEGQASMETTMNVLFGYIPTEIITLYVAVIAALGAPETTTGAWSSAWTTFWVFIVATPLVTWLVYGAKLKNLKLPLPLAFNAWPLWEMCAATAAFAAWAFALPNSPFGHFDWYSSALSGLVVLIASTVLGLLAPFFQRTLAA